MSFIEALAEKSAEIKVSKIQDFSKIEKRIFQVRNKRIILTKKDVTSIFKYSYQLIYGTIFEIILTLTIAALLGILLPTVVIMVVFAIVRMFIKGKHLNSSLKCLIFTTVVLIITGWFTSTITSGLNLGIRIVSYIVSGVTLTFISKTKLFEKLLNFINKKR